MNSKNYLNYKFAFLFLVIFFVFFVFYFLFPKEYYISYINQKERYYSIFMQSGQVYFGKVSEESKEYIVLTDVFYLQFADSNQGGDFSSQQNNFKLVKRGNELHGPEDKMYINKNFVLFIELLSDDSKVLKAISDSKK